MSGFASIGLPDAALLPSRPELVTRVPRRQALGIRNVPADVECEASQHRKT
jgi:hypothetical protein